MSAHGHDAGHVAEQLRTWLESEFGSDVAFADTPSSIDGGLDSWIHRVRFSGGALPDAWRGPLVARVKRTTGDDRIARREAVIQAWCANAGYPCPRLIVVFGRGDLLDVPVQVMELVPGSTILTAMTAAPWKTPRMLDRLAELHAHLHGLDPADFPTDGESEDLADRRLGLVRTTVAKTHDAALARGLELVEALLPRLRAAPVVACHGDFHPLNVMADGDRSWVLDWTDAGLGDRHGDVARTTMLFGLASIVATGRTERAALRLAGPWMARRYLRDYERLARLDHARLALWEPVHLLHGWSQVVGLHSGQFSDGNPDDRTSTVPAALGDQLRSRFATAISAVT